MTRKIGPEQDAQSLINEVTRDHGLPMLGLGNAISRRRFLGATGAVALGAVAAGCSSSPSSSGGSGGTSKRSTTTVTVMLDLLPSPDDAWLWTGMEYGYFKDEGIEIKTILPPADLATIPVLVGLGKVDVGFGSPPSMLLARNRGVPVIGIADLIPTRSDGIVSLKTKHINSLHDLVGKTFANYNSPDTIADMKQAMHSIGEPYTAVTTQFTEYTTPIITAGKVDAGFGLKFGEYIEVENYTGSASWIPLSNTWGIPPFPFYSLITSENFAHANGDLLKRFIVACMRSIKKYVLGYGAARKALTTCCSTGPESTGPIDVQMEKFDAFQVSFYRSPSDNPATYTYGLQDANDWKALLNWAIEPWIQIVPSVQPIHNYITNEFVTAAAKNPVT